ncbi:MAG: phosphoribosylformylglycinamidine synthase subunit PurL [Phycisphaerales bacterium]|nr:phosphoribosylformylglycinamidine synthase subunit PurL [Phycisphaerales bacterium]
MADPRGAAALREAQSLGLKRPPRSVESASIYLIEGPLSDRQIAQLAEELLTDPITEQATIGASRPKADSMIEVHPLPGVMDPDSEAVQSAVKAMLGVEVAVRTGRRFDLHGADSKTARQIAQRALANTVIHAIHDQPYHPAQFPHGLPYELRVISVPLLEMSDAQLVKLSREAHLFLSLEEMKAIQNHYHTLGRNPREIELETIAQTWSEHCVHKTMKATIRYREHIIDRKRPGIAMPGRPGHDVNPDGSVTIHNLLKSTIAAATHELIADGIDWCLSVFVDNAGVIAFDDRNAVCFKVETHNHPSAIEPYGGAATGIGGCIRDIIGTGLAAKPIAATDVFCVAHPDFKDVPEGCLPPRRILTQVVAGVRDYGNRMGIPTLNGAVWFDNDYVGNPLVFCGCIGVMPRDKIKGHPRKGDRMIAVGGRTGRDGIHGATFSSAELTDSHADEFSHAVQIGNAITEKTMLDAILFARDHPFSGGGCLFNAITDCGAGGFSSAVGEMGKDLGAQVHLDRAPLKYAGLSPTEIWISEAQERMILAVPPQNVKALLDIGREHDVEMSDLGQFGTSNGELVLLYQDVEVGRLSMDFLHDGLPETVREATWTPPHSPKTAKSKQPRAQPSISDALLSLLAHPNVASKRWIIQQYDHEVQGGTVIKPQVGSHGQGPSDAAVITPVAGSNRGLAIANGLATGLRDDPYLMALAAIDECVRNLVCVGADPRKIAILDNFCWPSCDDPQQLGALVRAAEACYDGAKAYRTPFISGKDSLNNQFTTEDGRTIRIPPTLLISGMGIVEDVRRCVTMDAKAAGNLLMIVGATDDRMGGSHYALFGAEAGDLPHVDLKSGPRVAAAVAQLITGNLVRSAHDCSEGGLLVAAAEMAFAGVLGLRLDLSRMPIQTNIELAARCFSETPSRYLIEVDPKNISEVEGVLKTVPHSVIGEFNRSSRLTNANGEFDVPIERLRAAWMKTLDW